MKKKVKTKEKTMFTMKKQITMFIHCRQCIEELPSGQSPESFAKNSIGWTKKGIQVWCLRHKTNVIHLDFFGQKVYAV